MIECVNFRNSRKYFFKGYYCPHPGMVTSIACRPGSFSNSENSTTCKPCPFGYTSQRGENWEWDNLHDYRLENNLLFKAAASQEECVMCPAGYFCQPEGRFKKMIFVKKSRSLLILVLFITNFSFFR